MVAVDEGAHVEVGDAIVAVEAMKMEHVLRATVGGTVRLDVAGRPGRARRGRGTIEGRTHERRHRRGRISSSGLYFEEFDRGAVYVHAPGRTVTEADNVLFTTLTMNTQSLHLDAAWAAGTEFGERLVNSMFTLSTLVGLSVAQLTQGTIVANLGLRPVRSRAGTRRRHALRRDAHRRQAPVVVATGAGHRGVRAHDAQPARRGRGHRDAHHPHAVPARRGEDAS
jgi:hypothetical protein